VREVDGGSEVIGFSFTPQDGNPLLSSVAVTSWLMYPGEYNERIQCLKRFFFQEV
jgi:glyceraldehyde-3-phosphate dehydrogenase (NAD(P))